MPSRTENKYQSGGNIISTPLQSGTSSSGLAVVFGKPFFTGTSDIGGSTTAFLPSISIAPEDAPSGAFYVLSAISRTGFTIVFKNSSNAVIDVKFTFQALGYGKGAWLMTRVNSTGKESSSNFSPDNGTGSAVRTAMKDIFESLRTVNSAAGDPSGAANLAAYQLHINTDSNLLKIRNGANSAFIELGNISQTNFGFLSAAGGTMTGAFLADDAGTASAPAISFDGDTDLGLFRKSANVLGFSASGTEQMIFDQNGLTLQAQNDLRFADSDSSNYVGFQAPTTVSSSLTWTLPATDAAVSGYALVSDASGTLSWAAAGGGANGNGTNEIFWENDQTVTGDYSITNGKNAGSFGPIEIASGVTVTVGAGETWTVV